MKSSRTINPIPWRMIRCLVDLWPSLPTECREAYGTHFREYWLKTPPYPVLLCLAAWSGTSSISEEEWILSALSLVQSWRGPQFKLVDASDAPERIPRFAPYPIPRIKDSSLRSVIDRSCIAEESMRFAKPGQSPYTLWWESMQRSNKPNPLPKWIPQYLRRMITNDRNIDIPDGSEIPSDQIHIRMNLLLAGLQEPVDSLIDILAYNTTRNRYFRLNVRNRDDLPSPWSDLLKSPDQAVDFIRNFGLDDSQLRGLLAAIVENPPAPEVLASIWQTLRERSHEEELESRLEAYGALFRLSPLVSSGQRLEMRAEFLRLLESTSVPRRHWPTDSMEPEQFERSVWPGEGIPWEDDALSAALSWSSDIKAETTFIPGGGIPETRTGVFSYVAQAFVNYMDEGLGGVFIEPVEVHKPVDLDLWKRAPLRNPLEDTPWQRARALHLRRPDLKWPERTWLRPVGRNH